MSPFSTPYPLFAIFSLAEHEDQAPDIASGMPHSLRSSVNELLSQIKNNTSLPLESQSNIVFHDFIKIRIDALNWLTSNENFDLLLKDVVFNELTHIKANISSTYLANRFERSTHICEKVTYSIFDRLTDSIVDKNSLVDSLNKIASEPEMELYGSDLLISSINTEFGLILADLYSSGEVILPPNKLADFLYDNAQRYGAFSLLTGVWKLDNKDNDNETLGCKILVELILMEKGEVVNKIF